MRDAGNAIEAEGVYKVFILPHERANSVKSIFTGIFRSDASRDTSQHALRDINFSIKQGEFFGIVGRNGSGKSTLLKILAGIYQPSKGRVETAGKLVPFIELGVGFNPELTGRENVFLNGAMLGFSQREIGRMYKEIVDFAELSQYMDKKLKNFSSGMQVRLAFSMAIRAEADILLVDEVLAVGDADFQRKCFSYFRRLKKDHRTVVFVSHDMSAVREFCDRAILIEDSKVIASGKGIDIANRYTRLFIDNQDPKVVDEALSVQAPDEPPRPPAEGLKRWGEGQVRIKNLKLGKHTYTDQDKEVVLDVTFKVEQPYDGLVTGFGIKDGADNPICGTNTNIKHYELPVYPVGQTATVQWRIPNIFAEGEQTVDVTLHGPDGLIIYDWWEEALAFMVKRDEKTAYPITPDIIVTSQKDIA